MKMSINTQPFQLNLSVSHKKVRSKEEGKKVVTFRFRENIPLDKTVLSEIFSSHLQSTNI